VHPIFGPQLVACRDLDARADFKTDVRRTKLTFDFVEANAAMAPSVLGAAIGALMALASTPIESALGAATWTPTPADQAEAAHVASALARIVAPAIDEESWDAIDRLNRVPDSYRTIRDVADPIVEATATVRRIHDDAVTRLESWNASITAAGPNVSPSVESLILIARLALARDLSLSVAQATYRTVGEALADLDFVMKLYDEEEAIAVHRCADELTFAIRAARAAAVRSILGANIRLPGVASIDVNGVWPSLVAAKKKYNDGRRYGDVEAYNPAMNPWFIGKTIVAPAA
jgi:prophage DNA circulation protein